MEENYRKGIVLIRGEKAGMIEGTDSGSFCLHAGIV